MVLHWFKCVWVDMYIHLGVIWHSGYGLAKKAGNELHKQAHVKDGEQLNQHSTHTNVGYCKSQ